MVQVSKRLVVRKEVPVDNARELVTSLDMSMADYYCVQKNYEKGLKMYRDMIPTLIENDRRIAEKKYMSHALNYAQTLYNEQKWLEAVEIYRDVINYSGYPVSVFKNIGLCMKSMGNADLAIKFLKRFEEISPDKEDVYIYLADLTYSDIKDYIKAIEYYEKALEKNVNNFSILNMLGHLYSTCHQDRFKDKQIDYFLRAYNLAPNNRIVVKNLAYVYGKFGEIQKADEFYAKLMYLNPQHSDLHAYGAYLVKNKRFNEGFKFLQHRFLKEDLGNVAFPQIFINNKKKRWNIKYDLSNKHVLLHFEQGFGDTIMFGRFIEQAKGLCGKLSVAVQDSLISLFKGSDLGVDIYREVEVQNVNYDYYVPMMDLPILCETTPDTIPNTAGYLKVAKSKINAYKKEHINDNDKLKIGIAFEGTAASKETDRDIPLEFMYPLMRMPEVEVYSFQVEDLTNQMDQIPNDCNLIRLGKTFKNWEDTACAAKCMDLMVTTDNGVMNLAGALGVKTFGLFNTITEWRWFKTTGDDIAWYKSIKPFQCPTSKDWGTPMKQVIEEVEKLQCKKIAKKIKKIK